MVGVTLLNSSTDKEKLVAAEDFTVNVALGKNVDDENVVRAQRRKKYVSMLLISISTILLLTSVAVGIWLLVNFIRRPSPLTWRRTCKYRLKPIQLEGGSNNGGRVFFDHGGLTAFDDGQNRLLPGSGNDIKAPAFLPRPLIGEQGLEPSEFQQDVNVDVEKNVATIDVPKIGFSNTIRTIEDFKLNLTVIRDYAENKCFVMRLDREHVPEPKSFIDIFNGMMNGQYLPNQEVLRKTMKVQMPPMAASEIQKLGPMIDDSCGSVPSFRLVPKTKEEEKASVRRRRSNDKPVLSYVYSVGRHALLYNIEN